MTITNETPGFIVNPVLTAVELIEKFGWFILAIFLVSVYIYHKYYPKYSSWKQKREEYRATEEAKKNPDKSYHIQVSVEQSRMKLQEQVNRDAAKRNEELAKISEQKRLEKIEEWEKHKQGKGYHSKYKPTNLTSQDSSNTGYIKPKKKTLKNQDYNPLSGNDGGGSCSWRPGSRRNISGGG